MILINDDQCWHNVHRRVSSSAVRGACSVFIRPGMLLSKNETCESRASESNFLYVLHQTSFSLKSTNNAARLPTTLGEMRKIHFCPSFTKQRSAFHREIAFLNFFCTQCWTAESAISHLYSESALDCSLPHISCCVMNWVKGWELKVYLELKLDFRIQNQINTTLYCTVVHTFLSLEVS